MENANKPINGIIQSETDDENKYIRTFTDYYNQGLTKREHFAGLALQGMLSHSTRYKPRDADNHLQWHDAITKEAVEISDSLLKALENE